MHVAENDSKYRRDVAPLMLYFNRKLDHQHIVTFYGLALRKEIDAGRVILVLEKCKETLKSYISNHPTNVPGISGNLADKKEVYRWAKQTSSALHYMHKQGIVQKDLRLENVMVSYVVVM